MRAVCIIQARMGSTRLPGKVLADIAGQSMLGRVVERVRRSHLIDDVVVATSVLAEDDLLADECRRLEVPVFRGHASDVLDRFHAAAVTSRADVIVRVTADCPLIDAGLIDAVLGAFHAHGVDHAGLLTGVGWAYPRGLDNESFSMAALERARREATATHDRAHVTTFLYGQPGVFCLLALRPATDLGYHRWTVDTADDLTFVRAVYQRLGADGGFDWREVWRQVTHEPRLAELNRQVRHKALVEG
jgi:spore coat polysaccharide biosynthesis protein SpsF